MGKKRKRTVSLVLITIMTLTMILACGAVTYAAEPNIVSAIYDMWLFPDETTTIGVALTDTADQVHLEINEGYGWYTGWTCIYQDSFKRTWTCDLNCPYGSTWTGTMNARFRITYNSGTSTKYSESFMINWNYDQSYERIAGEDRYKTAFAAAKTFRGLMPGEKYPNVIIASGLDFADALGGTYLAACKHAPILLVNDKSPQVIQDVAGEIQMNLYPGGTIYILGGTGAVNSDMEAALNAGGLTNIKRFAGVNRYDTNLQILNYCAPVGGRLLVCCANDFADALSASATGMPILLVGNTLLADHLKYLNSSVPDEVYVIGGTGAVPGAVETLLNDFGIPRVYRLAGANRYQTSAIVAAAFFTDKQRQYVTFAYGLDFPDGLSGGALSHEMDAPLLLVKPGADMTDACNVVQYGIRARRAKILGGPSLIPNSLVEEILNMRGVG